MASDTKDLPTASQHSTSSSLSDPPEFTDDEMREIIVNMAPITRRQSGYSLTITEQETNGSEAPLKTPGNNGSVSDNDDEIAVEIQVSPKATRRRVPSKRSQLPDAKPTASRRPAAKRPKTSVKKWEPDYATQNSKSPLVGRDLRALLLHPQSWDLLTADDKKEILALFPDEKHILGAGTPDARPDVLSLQNDDNFRHDTEDYVSNLSKDMHDSTWLQDAWAAHGSRAAGNFDQFYIRRLEADWKTTIPDALKPDNLRSTPKFEDSSVVGQRAEGDGAVDDEATGVNEVGHLEFSDTIMASGNTNGNGSIKFDDARADIPKNDVEDGLTTSSVTGIEKVPVAKVDETDGDDFDRMQTDPE